MERYRRLYEIFAKFIFKLSIFFEGIISLIILICIGIEIVTLIDTYEVFSADLSTVELRSMLGDILWLVIGLEFIKMLLEHSQGAVLDVMLFAIARQMVLEHGMLDNLIAVVAIAIVFAVRKFLYDKSGDRESLFAHVFHEQSRALNGNGELDGDEQEKKTGVGAAVAKAEEK